MSEDLERIFILDKDCTDCNRVSHCNNNNLICRERYNILKQSYDTLRTSLGYADEIASLWTENEKYVSVLKEIKDIAEQINLTIVGGMDSPKDEWYALYHKSMDIIRQKIRNCVGNVMNNDVKINIENRHVIIEINSCHDCKYCGHNGLLQNHPKYVCHHMQVRGRGKVSTKYWYNMPILGMVNNKKGSFIKIPEWCPRLGKIESSDKYQYE